MTKKLKRNKTKSNKRDLEFNRVKVELQIGKRKLHHQNQEKEMEQKQVILVISN